MTSGTVVVTGAAGLLGSHLLPLLGGAARVVAVGRSPPAMASPNIESLALDLSAPIDFANLPKRADAVVCLAQSSRYRDFPDSAKDIFQVNIAQVAAMLDYARHARAKTFVYASTGSVYGCGGRAFTEDSSVPPVETLGFYPATKLCGEILAAAYAPMMNVAILRYFFIYGRGQKANMLMPRLVDSVRSGRPVALQGGEGIRINPVHVSDAAAATARALTLEGLHRINVAGPETVSIRRICETAGKLLGATPVFAHEDVPPCDIIGDTALMKRLLHRPERFLAAGLQDLL